MRSRHPNARKNEGRKKRETEAQPWERELADRESTAWFVPVLICDGVATSSWRDLKDATKAVRRKKIPVTAKSRRIPHLKALI
jgi:hypothetical protein